MVSRIAPCAAMLALVACGSGPKHVDVAGTADDLRFTVVADAGGESACANALSVGPVEPEDAEPVWQVSSLGSDACLGTLRYGAVADGISQVVGPAPLRPGVPYRVRMSGAGFSEVRDFTVSPGGVTILDQRPTG